MTHDADVAEDGPTRYALGPQSDGSIIVRIPDDSHLMTATRALEKQLKNAAAARGTIAALKDKADPLLDEVERELTALVTALRRARAPENQIAGTPIGEAIAQANGTSADTPAYVGTNLEPIDGIRGQFWDEGVPQPRPKLDQYVRGADGTPHAIWSIVGWNEEARAFLVETGSDSPSVLIEAHWNFGTGQAEWRFADNRAAYSSPLVGPDSPDWARKPKSRIERPVAAAATGSNTTTDTQLSTKQQKQRAANAKAAGVKGGAKTGKKK